MGCSLFAMLGVDTTGPTSNAADLLTQLVTAVRAHRTILTATFLRTNYRYLGRITVTIY